MEDLCRLLPVGAMRPHEERKEIPIVRILLVDAMRPHAEIVVISPMLAGAMHTHAGGGDGIDSTTCSVSFRSSHVVPPFRCLESAGGMSMICCRGRDRMISLVVKVELKALPEMNLLVGPLDLHPSGTVICPLSDRQEVVHLVGMGTTHPTTMILVPPVLLPPLEEEGGEAVAMVMVMTPTVLEVPRFDVERSRHKHRAEAAEIRLEILKPIARYPEWCSSLADAVMAASGVGDRVWDWIQAPAHRNATMGAMADPGDKYRSLDAKLAKALRIAANGCYVSG